MKTPLQWHTYMLVDWCHKVVGLLLSIGRQTQSMHTPLCSGFAASASKWLNSIKLLLSAAAEPSFKERFFFAWQATRHVIANGDGMCPCGCGRGAEPGGKEDLLLLIECLSVYGMRQGKGEFAWEGM